MHPRKCFAIISSPAFARKSRSARKISSILTIVHVIRTGFHMTTKCNILFSADENTLKQNKFQKSGLFNNGFYGQDIVMAFLSPKYCRLFA